MEITLQKIKLQKQQPIETAQRYYKILSAVSDTPLTTRDIQLLAFTAIHGDIIYKRDEFCKEFKCSLYTAYNIISKLKKMGLLIKKSGTSKVMVHPSYKVDFTKDLIVQITIPNGEAT